MDRRAILAAASAGVAGLLTRPVGAQETKQETKSASNWQ
jgi:hypothetical protein